MSLVSVCSVIENVHKVSGIALNLLLLYLISVYSRKSLGTYKTLLIVFATSDIILTLVHTVIVHQVVSVGTTFSSVGYIEFLPESRYLTAIFCAGYTVVFSLSFFNFLNRFWAVKHPNRLRFYSNNYFVALLALIAATNFAFWYLLCNVGMTGAVDEIGTIVVREEFRRRYGRTVIDGFQVLDHWRDGEFNLRTAVVLLLCDATIVFCISIIGLLAFLCFYHIRKADKMSPQSQQLQAKLLVTLCAQTAVPIICVFGPYFTVMTLPFFAVDITTFNIISTAFISFFPTCDAIVIILLTNDYREGLKTMILRRKKQVSMAEKATAISKFASSMVD